MSRLTAIASAAKGIAAGLCQTLADYRKGFEALRRMEQSQQRAMLTLLRSTAVICEMDKQAMLARKIEDDEDRRLQKMTEKEARERIDYIDRKIAKRLSRLNGAQEKAAFMAELFGRDARREMERLFMIYPELM